MYYTCNRRVHVHVHTSLLGSFSVYPNYFGIVDAGVRARTSDFETLVTFTNKSVHHTHAQTNTFWKVGPEPVDYKIQRHRCNCNYAVFYFLIINYYYYYFAKEISVLHLLDRTK